MARLDLDVFLEASEAPVGRLSRDDTGSTSFAYLDTPLPYPLSMSLPLREEPYGDIETRAFFGNLLFENAQRDQVMERHGLAFGDVVGLLYHLGRDCPGAISCVPAGAGPAKRPGRLDTDYDALDAADLARLITSLRDHRRVPEDTLDPSPLAGVQGKVALTRLEDGRLALPKPGLNVPTTHILKVPRRTAMRGVDHEHLLMTLMAELQDHPVSETEILGEGDPKALLVTRFDRRVATGGVSRVHQEDFCQALGLGPHLKYQRDGAGARAFTTAAIGQLLNRTEQPGMARQAFLEITMVNLLLGNTDAHAKNHALLHEGPRPHLAPVYDVVPTLIDDRVTHQLAFDIGAARMTDEIAGADLERLVTDLGFRRMTPAMKARLRALVTGAVARIDAMRGPARKRLGDAMAEQAGWLARALELDIEIPERDLVVINRP